MDLFVDISAAVNQQAGIGRYAREVSRRLIRRERAHNVTLWYAANGSNAHDAAARMAAPGTELRRSPLSRQTVDRLGFRAGLPIWRLLNLGSADVAWSPDFTVPPVPGARRVLTVHDLAWRNRPEYAPAGLRSFLDAVMPAQIRAADAIVVVSESTRTALLDRFDVGARPVLVAPNGVDERFAAAGERPDRAVLRHLDLPDSYLLMVGTIEPRKNHQRVVEALMMRETDVPLVVAGGKGWNDGPIRQTIARAVEAGVVRYLGYVDDAVLPQLYANAAGLIAASVDEGFDLPVLEAMAAGLPLLLSDIPVHHEIAGGLAHYFDPLSVNSINDGIIAFVSKSDGVEIARHRSARASRFSWEETAESIGDFLRTLG